MADTGLALGWGTLPVVMGGLYWLLKEALKRRMDQELDRHKAELQRGNDAHKAELEKGNHEHVERLKAELSLTSQRELERLKADLALQNESLKHQYQIERVKLEAANKQKHEVYAQLLEKLRVAEGAVGRLWGARYSQDYASYGVEDLVKVVEGQRLLDSIKTDLISAIRDDKKEGVKKLEKWLRQLELQDARSRLTEAKNYLVLKALWTTPAVKEASFNALRKLNEAFVEVEVGEQDPTGQVGKQYDPLVKESGDGLNALEEQMRKEISPAG